MKRIFSFILLVKFVAVIFSKFKIKKANNNYNFCFKSWDKVKYIDDLDCIYKCSPLFENDIKLEGNFLDDFFAQNDFLTIKDSGFFCYISKNVMLYPGLSEIIYTQNGIYLTRESQHKDSYNSQEFSGLMEFDSTFEYARIKSDVRVKYVDYINSGIDLTHCINNYWHVLVEIAPKAILANVLNIPFEIPLLLPDNLHNNFLDLIKSVCGKRDIIFVHGYNSNDNFFPLIKVKNLYSINNYYSWIFHPRNNIFENPMCSEISLAPLRLTINSVLDYYKITPHPNKEIKLVLVRNSGHRVSSSQNKLVELALGRGYIIFEPEKMSFEEQIRLTSRASSIVGFFGAALSNTFFMHSRAKKILIGNPGFYSVASFWNATLQNAYILKNDVISDDSDGIHSEPVLSEQNWLMLDKIL